MDILWGPFLSFVFVAHITPGPNNLNAAAMGLDSGYRRTLPFIFGVYLGLSILLLISGMLKLAVSDFFYRNILIFRIAGSAYLLWLAWGMVRKNDGAEPEAPRATLLKGLTLQFVNPKALFFCMTLYALFISGTYSWRQTAVFSFTLPLATFFFVSLWALAGSFLSKYLEDPRHRKIFFRVMALLLVYTVVTLYTGEFA
jgi:cysteine/O-acetylserine efflux protein